MQGDLVERVTCAIYGEDSLDGLGSGVTSIMRSKGALAVAAVLDALKEPSEVMLAQGEKAGWDSANHMPAIHATPAIWQAMLTAFREENAIAPAETTG